MASKQRSQSGLDSPAERQSATMIVMIVAVLLLALGYLIVATSGARSAQEQTFSLAGSPLGPAGLSIPAINGAGGSSSWYCVWPSAEGSGSQSGAIVLTNISPARSVVHLFRRSSKSVGRSIVIPGDSVIKVSMASYSVRGAGGLSVLGAGGQLAVGMEMMTSEGLVVSPCQSSPGFYWVIQGGSTQPGSSLRVAIFNPFSNPSVLDVRLLSVTGSSDLGSLQGVIVEPGRTKVLNISRIYAGHQFVVVEIRARAGRVVASGLAQVKTSSMSGVSLITGVTRPSPGWYFPQLFNSISTASKVVIFNPSSAAITADVKVVAAQGRLAGVSGLGLGGSQFSQVIQPDSFSIIDLTSSTSLPSASGYGLSVTDNGQGLVVSTQLIDTVAGQVGRQINEVGNAVPAARWVVIHIGSTERVGFAVMDNSGHNSEGSYRVLRLIDRSQGVVGSHAGGSGVRSEPITVLRSEVLLQDTGDSGVSVTKISLAGKGSLVGVAGLGVSPSASTMSFPIRS